MVSSLSDGYSFKISSLEQELHSLRYDLNEAYTHIDAFRNTLATDQQKTSRRGISPIEPEVPEDVELSFLGGSDPAVASHVPHDIEEQDYDAKEDMRRLRAQVCMSPKSRILAETAVSKLEALCRSSPTNTRALEIQSDDGAITTAAHSPDRDATPVSHP